MAVKIATRVLPAQVTFMLLVDDSYLGRSHQLFVSLNMQNNIVSLS